MAQAGVLGLTKGADGAPGVPPILAADIAGGTYPAVINILLALRQRDLTGRGSYLDLAMADNLFTFNYWGLGNGFSGDRKSVVSGKSVSVRVDLGSRRNIKKTHHTNNNHTP